MPGRSGEPPWLHALYKSSCLLFSGFGRGLYQAGRTAVRAFLCSLQVGSEGVVHEEPEDISGQFCSWARAGLFCLCQEGHGLDRWCGNPTELNSGEVSQGGAIVLCSFTWHSWRTILLLYMARMCIGLVLISWHWDTQESVAAGWITDCHV